MQDRMGQRPRIGVAGVLALAGPKGRRGDRPGGIT